jgi:endonuclease/exonuclease/phosphatase (EEP) superfamily protein YafD
MSAFRVMQFNMQFGQVWDDADPDHAPVDLDATIREIRRHNADIVLLQEVEHAGPNGTQPPVPPNYSRLRSAFPEYDGVFAFPKPDVRELPFGIGLAILSRTPLEGFLRVDLPSPPVEFDFLGDRKTPTDRLLIGAGTKIGGHSLKVFNTHLLAFFMLKTSSSQHPEQRQRVVDLLKAQSEPALVGGDFNVRGHDALKEQFAEAGMRAVQQGEVTWRRMPFALDHVFFNGGLRCVGRAVQPTLASDHHVLLADFEFA